MITFMSKLRHTIAVFLSILFISLFIGFYQISAQVTAVVDAEHNNSSTIEAVSEGTNLALKQIYENPAWERISKVQQFLKDASTIISNIIKNLKITRELVEVETDIIQIFDRTSQLINESESLPKKWLYQKMLIELWAEKLTIFEVFDLATRDNITVMDDESRILLIKQSLIKAKQIKKAMRIIVQRANKDIYLARSTEREIAAFSNLFK